MNLLYDKMPFYYFVSNEENGLIDINEPLYSDLGYTKIELIGKNIQFLFTIATRIFFETHFSPLLKLNGFASEIFITLQAKDRRQLSVLCNAKIIVENDEPVTAFICIAVENRKKFENELIEARNQAEKALSENISLKKAQVELKNNMETLDYSLEIVKRQNEELRQFNHVITHELQEPLRKLFVFTDILTADTNITDPGIADIAKKVARTSAQMQAVVVGLQKYIWLTQAKNNIEKLNLDDIFRHTETKITEEQPGVTFSSSINGLPPILGDPEQIQLLIYNVLDNAVRFRKPGNPVSVRVNGTILKLNKFQNNPNSYAYTDYLKIDVQDKGVGFDAEYKTQIFDLFKKLHPVSGQGIGLAICKKIVDNHSGKIIADSKAGEGTTISIFLPVENIRQ